jgi:hypothetical protein
MNKMDLRVLLAEILVGQQEVIDQLSGSTNPQTVTMVHQLRATQEAFDAVLKALRGDPSILKTYKKER